MDMLNKPEPWEDEMRYTAALDEKLNRRPICICCKCHIQDEYAVKFKRLAGISEVWLCKDCITENEVDIDD